MEIKTKEKRGFSLSRSLIFLFLISLLGVVGWQIAEKVALDQLQGLEIVIYPNPILREVAQPVEEIGPREQELAQLMVNTMKKAGGLGLAAPQVGVSQRIIVVKLERGLFDKEILVMINPEIIERSASIVYDMERCLSVRGNRVNVPRSEWVKVNFSTLEGQEKTLTESHWNARIIQHEIDHLNGILIIDYQ